MHQPDDDGLLWVYLFFFLSNFERRMTTDVFDQHWRTLQQFQGYKECTFRSQPKYLLSFSFREVLTLCHKQINFWISTYYKRVFMTSSLRLDCSQPRYYSTHAKEKASEMSKKQKPSSILSSLPFCAGVQFSRDFFLRVQRYNKSTCTCTRKQKVVEQSTLWPRCQVCGNHFQRFPFGFVCNLNIQGCSL